MVKYNTAFLRPTARKDFDKREQKQLFLDLCLGAEIYRNADIIPNKDNMVEYGGVVTSNGVFVDNSALHEGLGKIYDYNADFMDIPVIYVGFLFTCWGHVITDFIKKLWFLNSIEGKKWLSNGAKVCYISMGNPPKVCC